MCVKHNDPLALWDFCVICTTVTYFVALHNLCQWEHVFVEYKRLFFKILSVKKAAKYMLRL